jgi:hypothetical protein
MGDKPHSYAMSGDLGDVLYSLRIAHQINDPRSTYYLVDRPFTKPWNQARLDALTPLMEAQPYIGRVAYGEYEEEPTHNFTDFRRGGLPWGMNLADTHAAWVKVKLRPYTPWLTIDPSTEMVGKVLVHRSPRYHNPLFPWRQLGEAFGDRMVAVGVEDEYAVIQDALGLDVPLRKTKDYAELARLIAGCSLFIGNQSSPMAIALGLGVPVVQEVCLRHPDCVYQGANACYSHNGLVVISGEEYGHGQEDYISTTVTPPGGWQFVKSDGSVARGYVFSSVVASSGATAEEVLKANTRRVRASHPTYQPSKMTRAAELLGQPASVTCPLDNKPTKCIVP